jgi:hypothetical protein
VVIGKRLIKGAEQFAGDLPYLFQQFTKVKLPKLPAALCQYGYQAYIAKGK